MKFTKQSILVIGGTIGLKASVGLHTKGHTVLHVGRRKITGIGDSVIIDGIRYQTPILSDVLPRNKSFDVIIIATKLFDTLACIQQLKDQTITTNTLIIIQNGLVNKDFYRGIRMDCDIVTLSIFEGLTLRIEEETTIITSSVLSEGRQVESSQIGEKVAHLFQGTIISCILSPDIENTRAWKMLLNSAINGLSAIYQMNAGETLEHHALKINQLFDEAYDVLSQQYILGEKEQARKTAVQIYTMISKHSLSTAQDVSMKRKTEIDFLNGYIIKLGKQYSILTPVNQRVYDEIKKIESAYLL